MTDAVNALVKSRRKALGDPSVAAVDDPVTWGLALSGGGIRSATFCLGLVKALAKNGALLRFDLMSTVSGGGYVGAMLGKLFDQAANAQEVRRTAEALGDCGTRWFTWWLRANGRYLIPRGFKDVVFAITVYLRNLLAIHFEIGVLGLLLGAVLAAGNWLVWPRLANPLARIAAAWPGAGDLLAWLPTLWLWGGPLLLFAAVVLCCSFWALLEGERSLRIKLAALVLLWVFVCHVLCAVRPVDAGAGRRILGLWAVPSDLWWPGTLDLWWWLLILGAAAWSVGVVIAFVVAWWKRDWCDEARLAVTNALAALGRFGFVTIGLLGLIDRLAWYLAFELAGAQKWYGGSLLTAAALLRALLPRLMPSSGTLRPWAGVGLHGLGHVAGLALLFLLAVWWVSLAYTFVFDGMAAATTAAPTMWRIVLLLAFGAAYALVSGHNVAFLNFSSLHAFYRARLARGYLGAANGDRFVPCAQGACSRLRPLDEVPAEEPVEGFVAREVTDIDAGDDNDMRSYKPHRNGGPVHLINVCVNQTRDCRGGLFNQDRRGLPMTVVGRALEPGLQARVGSLPWSRIDRDGAMTLGSWMAISGAAFAPGLGSRNRKGVSALATLAGLRLGYWWDSAHLQDLAPAQKFGSAHRTKPATRGSRRVGVAEKARLVVSELFGRFDATTQQRWYLSDGGHYENTGAYALLAEEARVVVVADCGADPRFAFGDLENLVRKARIDFGADIEFLRPDPARADDRIAPFGSLRELVAPGSSACLALARIKYRRTGAIGHLVVVKPNMNEGLPVDLINFKSEHPDFPQESTTDQMFSEAQWESYFKLGQALGRRLTRDLLSDLALLAAGHFTRDDGAPVGRSAGEHASLPVAAAPPSAKAAGDARPGRLADFPVAASLGFGAVATLAFSLWQSVDGARASNAERAKVEQVALKEITDAYGRLSATPERDLGALVGALLRVADTSCPGGIRWFHRSSLAQCILRQATQMCGSNEQAPPSCATLLDAPAGRCLDAMVVRSELQSLPRYWGQPVGAAAPEPACPRAHWAGAPPPTPCSGKTILVHRRGPQWPAGIDVLRHEWRLLGAVVPPPADAAAERRGAGSAEALTSAAGAVRLHDEASRDCAKLLFAKAPEAAVDVSFAAAPTPGVIDVWLGRDALRAGVATAAR